MSNFLVITFDRKCKSCVCHVNGLKAYVDRSHSKVNADSLEEDSLMRCSIFFYPNSVILQDLPHFLSHLTNEQSKGLTSLLCAFTTLFSDVPSRTTVHS